MATGYTRQAAANIAASLTIASADLNAEFNQAQSAFDITTGHDHSGSSAGTGAKIILTTAVSGVLPVLNGGTGVTTKTGTGSVVLSASPTFTGTITAATISGTTLQTNGTTIANNDGVHQILYDFSGNADIFLGGAGDPANYYRNTSHYIQSIVGGVTYATFGVGGAVRFNQFGAGALYTDGSGNVSTGTLAAANGGTGVTTSTGTGNNVLSASPTLTGTAIATNITASGTLTAATINATSSFQLNGATFGVADATFNVIYDRAGNSSIFLGSVGDPTNYYRNTNHLIGNIGGGTTFAAITSTGIVATNKLGVNGSGTPSSNVSLAVVDPGSGLSGSANALNLLCGNALVLGLTTTSVISNVAVGIGTPPGIYTLNCNGSAAKPGGGSWTDSSDIRLKTNIVTEFDALNKIKQLKPSLFEWKNPDKHPEGQSGGFIAQDILKVFPEFILEATSDETEDGKAFALTLPFKFYAYLVKAIQELDKKIENK